ncbi:MAG: DUF222 domain-containing protein [Micrococcus sp.]|nr:DUF222 domain-containing protein [Micrococcus sp.]
MDETNGLRQAMDGGDLIDRTSMTRSSSSFLATSVPAGSSPLTGVPASSGPATPQHGTASWDEASGSPSSAPWPDPLREAHHLSQLVETLGDLPAAMTEAEAVDWISGLERVKAACAAAQVLQTEALYALRCEEEGARGVPAAERGWGVAAEVALARRESPSRGSRELSIARTLMDDLPCTREALRRGEISEYKASLMVKETSWLPRLERREVDALMADRLAELGNHRLAGEARAHAQRLDPAAAVRHAERAVSERRVSVRPAPGGMAYLTALLPMTQAVACRANLQRAAASTVGTGTAAERTQDQVMADLLVERVTGQRTAQDVPVEVHLVMTDRALLAGDGVPAWLIGHGPVPAGTARDAIRDSAAEVFLRRLYTEPATGQLVGMDSRRREFSGMLRRMVILREDTCRTPWCDAPIRHIDHATPARDGGATDWENASGLCARCNYTKENPGWTHHGSTSGLEVVTPTGHRYQKATGPVIPPVRPTRPAWPPGLPTPEVVFPRATRDRHRGKPIPMEAADITLPPRPADEPWIPAPDGISLPEAHLALYLAAA